MAVFNSLAGPVTASTTEKGISFEVVQAMQGEVVLGALRFDWTRTGAIIKTLVGHGHLAYLPAYLRISNAALAHTGRFVYFTDYWNATAYDSQLRIEFTDWLTKNHSKDDGCHTLVRSKMISMGVAVMNATLGGTQTHYTSRLEFERVVAKHALPSKRPMPHIHE
jgi:hypothetical protein